MENQAEVWLREVDTSDLEIFYEHQREPEGAAMAAFVPRERDEHLAHWAKILADDGVVARTVVVDGEVAGNVVSFPQDGRREIGYWIGKEHRAKGIATRALAALLEIVHERPLYAWVAPNNVASIRVLERCGFTRASEQPEPEPGSVRYVVMELPA